MPTGTGRRIHDPADDNALGEHVVVVPLAGWAACRGTFEDQGHGRIITRAKAYCLTVVVFPDTVLEALRDPFRATAILHLQLCTKSMPGGCVDQSEVPFQ